MAYDASIIMQGQPINVLGALQAGNDLAKQKIAMQRENALANLYQTQGAGLVNGDPNAVNALAGMDPSAAMNFRQAQQGMAADAEKMSMLREEWRNKTADRAKAMSDAEKASAAAQIEQGVAAATAAQSPEQWDQIVTQFGAPDLAGQFSNRQAIINSYLGVKDALSAAQGPEWRPATPQEAAARGAVAGQVNTRTGKFDAQNPPSGMSITSDGHGGLTVNQGPGVTSGQSGGSAVSSPEAMVSTIDGILSDPALDYSTGILSYGQNIPGTPMKRFQGRASQLNGQAFLQAFASLKGGGQITEIEGAKATQAIGRLDTAQSPDDYRSALGELKSILTLAQQRPRGWVYNQPDPTLKQGNMPDAGAVENGYRFKGGDPASADNWEKVQ